ncbi:MAG: RNA polymerase sigma factor [Candidatus Merdivicinus sp.]|jgi:RNA polymerase sigma factor (sigma-70 family)
MNDEQIIELYWNRSEDAITQTDCKYGAYCRKISMNILHNEEDTEECVSDAYLGVWNAIPPQRPHAFSAFLGKITRNISLHRWQKNRAGKRGGGDTGILLSELEECLPARNSFDETLDSRALGNTLNAFLDTLTSEQRIIFVRRYWYADPIEEISFRMGLSSSKVTSVLFRLRKKLLIFLQKEGFSV